MEGQLGHKKFDFNVWNRTKISGRVKEYKCGYAGCAIGECPIVFPGSWVFGIDADPCLKENRNEEFIDPGRDAEEFFGLIDDEVNHLFVPGNQNHAEYGGMPLSEKATRQQVAMNIYAFIEVKKKEMEDND